MATYREIVEAPRWAGFSSFVRSMAFMKGLDLKIDVDKGWVRETVRFEVSGEDQGVNEFRRMMEASIDDYLRRTNQRGKP